MVAYSLAGPVWSIVLPSRIELLVIPTSVWGAGVPEPPQATRATRAAATAARRGPFRAIEIPPALMTSYLNSLGIGWHMSSFPIAGPPKPGAKPGVAVVSQADDAVGREDHDQDQEGPVADGGSGVVEDGGDLARGPWLAGGPPGGFG